MVGDKIWFWWEEMMEKMRNTTMALAIGTATRVGQLEHETGRTLMVVEGHKVEETMYRRLEQRKQNVDRGEQLAPNLLLWEGFVEWGTGTGGGGM